MKPIDSDDLASVTGGLFTGTVPWPKGGKPIGPLPHVNPGEPLQPFKPRPGLPGPTKPLPLPPFDPRSIQA